MPKTYFFSFSRKGPYSGPFASIEEAKDKAREQIAKDSLSEHRIFIGVNETIYPCVSLMDCHDLLESIRHGVNDTCGIYDTSYLTDLTEEEKVILVSLVRAALRQWADRVGEHALMHVVSNIQEYPI